MKIKNISTLLILLTVPTAAFSKYDVVIQPNIPINFINQNQTPEAPTPEPEPETGKSVHNITVGLHPNYSKCANKLKGFGINSICNAVQGSYGSIDNNVIKINGNSEIIGQVYGYPSGSSCNYAFQIMNNNQYDSLPNTLSMTWNGSSYTGTKDKAAFPSFISYRFITSCDMWNSWSTGTNLNIQTQQ